MLTTVDDAGRITIPREIVESLGLKPGMAIQLEPHGLDIRVWPAAGVEYRDGVPFLTSGVEGDPNDLLGLIDRIREERDLHNWGPQQ